MKISAIDHLVLTVRDLDVTCDFYSRVLGMQVVTFGEGRWALHFGQQKINLHEVGREFMPNAQWATAGSADLCFISNSLMSAIVSHLHSEGVEIIEGPVAKTGAQGPIQSVYFYDPDGNLIEVLCTRRLVEASADAGEPHCA